MRQRFFVLLLVFTCICNGAQAFKLPSFRSSKTSEAVKPISEAELDELASRQDAELDKLRNEYYQKARRECPRKSDGSIDADSKQYKNLAGEFSKKHLQIQDKYVTNRGDESDVQGRKIKKIKPSEPDKKQIENELGSLLRGGGAIVNGELNAAKAEAAAKTAKAQAAKAEAQADSAKAQAEAKAEAAKAEATKAKAEAGKVDSAKAQAEAAQVDSAKAQAESSKAKAEAAKTEAAKTEAEAKAEAAKAEAEARAEAKAEADAKAKAAKKKAAQADSAKAKAEAKAEVAKAEAEAKTAAKAEAEAKAEAKAEVAKAEAAKAEAAKAEAAKAEADVKAAKAEAEAKAAKAEAEAKAKVKAEADAKAAQAAAEAKAAKAEAVKTEQAKAKAEAEAKAAQAEAKAEAAKAETAKAEAAKAEAAKAEAAKAEAAKAEAAKAEAAKAEAAKAEAAKAEAAKAEAAKAEAAKAETAKAEAAKAEEAKTKAEAAQAKAEAAKTEATKAEAAKAQADAKAEAAKTKAETAKTNAETARANTADAQIEAAKAKAAAEAPKTKTNTPDVDVPKTKVNAPDVPKINVDVPSVKTKIKAGAGKALKAGGDAVQAVDIFSTAEDVKKDLKEGKVKDAAEKIGLAVADEFTGGAVSTGKLIVDRTGDKSGMQAKIKQANEAHQQRYEGEAYVKLVKEGNLSIDEAKAVLEAQRNGDTGALDRKMKELGVKPPELKVEDEIGPDDNWEQRSLEVQEGVKNNVKKAGKFLKEAGEDTTEIATGLTEKGVLKQAYENTKENTKGWLQNWRENRQSDQQEKDAHESMKDYYIKKGASESAAEKAASDYEKGNKESGRKLSDMLDWQKDRNDAAERGEEKKDFDEWKKERDEARNPKPTTEKDLRDAEGKTDPTEQADKGDGEKEGKGILEWLSEKKDAKDRENTESSTRIASSNKDMQDASTSGDQDDRESKSIINSAGRDAENTKDQAARESAKADRDNSMGKTIGDAVENSITKGGEALGEAIGKAGADKVSENIFEKNKPDKSSEAGDSGKAMVAGIKATGDQSVASGDSDEDDSSGNDIQVSSSSDNNDDDGEEESDDGENDGGDVADGDSDGEDSDENEKPGAEVKSNPSSTSTGESLMIPPSKTTSATGGQTKSAPKSATKSSKSSGSVKCGTCGGYNTTLQGVDGSSYWCKDCSKAKSTPTGKAKTASSPKSGTGECIRCAAPKKNVEPLCLSCTTRVMSSYGTYLTSNGRQGGQDSQYFSALSSGAKAQIERNIEREKEKSANRKPYEGGAVDTTFP